ncbi:MAG: hypothetical protein A2015_07815 [Spirochaetes bacterium GWF1_31_7]|nr:MAG: hypothetical protein A2Y30_01910 [Spirochaetes bacterium GWE1_32_154]OHD46948.1 MAG: hypothetical protein A2015_07815 [Spirochaetes bacterium GWF1_31_7]OHD48726.1 MAG: hypothetical protein A2Y29_14045 [Spirochaetes bacterium GWE2_31_10]HBD95545.1 hypothetical protein [Spirochaetia bacterium]HBI36944.1 hypothetical protein [Spirochaetia bacterium]
MKYTYTVLITGFLLFIAGCSGSYNQAISPQTESVTLTVRTEDTSGLLKTILPLAPVSMTYTLTGTPSGGNNIVLGTFTTLPATVQIAPGTWDLNLEAKDTVTGKIAFTDSKTAQTITVSTGIAFSLKPATTGIGDMKITLSWDVSNTVTQALVTINDVSADSQPVISGNTVTYQKTGLVNGGYLVSFRLFNASGSFLTSFTELVRVVPNLVTEKTIALTALTDFNKAPQNVPVGLNVSLSQSMDSNYGSVYISWTDTNTNETGHSIDVYSDGVYVETVTVQAGQNYWYYSALRNTVFTCTVSAGNSLGQTAYTAVSSAITIPLLHLINFLAPDATGGSMSTQYAEEGQSVFLYYNSFTRTGYTFSGWTTVPQGTVVEYTDQQQITMGTTDMTFNAVWEPQTYTITYNDDGATTQVNPATQTITFPATIGTFPEVPVKTGFEFGGWWTGSGGTGSEHFIDTPVYSDMILYAKWISVVYVSESGNDTNNGTSASPYATVEKAFTMVEIGGEVRIAGGTYTVGAELVLKNGVTVRGGYDSLWNYIPADYLTILTRNAAGSLTGISGSNLYSTITIDSIILNITSSSGDAVYGVNLTNCSPVNIKNCKITVSTNNSNAYGISASNSFSGVIENNTITVASSPRYAYGIYFTNGSSMYVRIHNNIIIVPNAGNYDSIGVAWSGGTGYTLYVRNNLIRFGTDSAPKGFAAGMAFYSSGNPTVNLYFDNNIAYSSSATSSARYVTGKGEGDYPAFVTIQSMKNNIMFNVDGYTYDKQTPGNTYTAINNLETGITPAGTASGNQIYNLLSESQFVNESLGDFHWTATPNVTYIEMGLDGSDTGLYWGFDYDMEGNPRTGDSISGWSVGPYESDFMP